MEVHESDKWNVQTLADNRWWVSLVFEFYSKDTWGGTKELNTIKTQLFGVFIESFTLNLFLASTIQE